MRRVLIAAVTSIVAVPVAVTTLAAPAAAMHDSPSPIGEIAPEWSGHYTTPTTGRHGAARPWEAGPAWNR